MIEARRPKMIRAEQVDVNSSILGGIKYLLLAGLGVILFLQFGPMGGKKAADAEVSAASYPFTVPKGIKDGYIGENPQILNSQSVWEFRMRNNGHKEITNINFELPFSGSYYVQDGNSERQSGILNFARAVKIERLDPGQYLVLTLWAGEKLDSEFEGKIRVSSDEGVLSVEYPVVAGGLLAWVDRYKIPLTLTLVILLVITVL